MDGLLWILVLGAGLAGFVQGVSGSNFGLVAMAVWAWVLEPALTGPLVVCGSLTGQLLAAGALRRIFVARHLLPMVGGGLVGAPMGILLLQQVDPAQFRLGVGLLLALWCPFMLLSGEQRPRIRRGGHVADAGVGVLGGILGGLGGLTGPAPALWATLRGWERDTQRAVIQGFNLSMQALLMGAYLVSGTIGAEAFGLFPAVIAATLVPALIGVRLYRRISDLAFRRLVLGLLTVSGVILVSRSLPQLL